MPINLDLDLENADWPKRTDDVSVHDRKSDEKEKPKVTRIEMERGDD